VESTRDFVLLTDNSLLFTSFFEAIMLKNPFEDPVRRRRLIGYGFVGAMVVAPFLGLLLGAGAGLLVMAVALGATSFVAFDLLPTIPVERRVRVKRLGIVCVALAVACLIAALFVW
jgi:hypothetical protein